MAKEIDLTKSVYELTNEYPELIDIMAGAQFCWQADDNSEGCLYEGNRYGKGRRCADAEWFYSGW